MQAVWAIETRLGILNSCLHKSVTLVFERILLGHALKCPAASYERFFVGCPASEHLSIPGTLLNAPFPTRIGCNGVGAMFCIRQFYAPYLSAYRLNCSTVLQIFRI